MEPNLNSNIDPTKPGIHGYVENGPNPYDVYLYPNFLDEQIFQKLRDEAKQIPLKKKYSDMFHFFQSQDIDQFPEKNGPLLKQFIEMMKTTTKSHLQKRLNIELDDESPLDITVSRYDHYNYLLCHNDHTPDPSKNYRRAMAFIYYLTSGKMEAKDGGGLSLYACDELKQPHHVKQKIYPTANMLLVFPTSDTSWHSVDEVLSFQHNRLSINGWFNSSKLPKLPEPVDNYREPCPYTLWKPSYLIPKDMALVERIINNQYLDAKFLKEASQSFKTNKMIKLNNILKTDIYDAIALDLHTTMMNKQNQVLVGPANKRNYGIIENTKLTPITRLVHKFFRSAIFLNLIKQYTGREFVGPELTSLKTAGDDSDLSQDKTEDYLKEILQTKADSQASQQVADLNDPIGQKLPRMAAALEGKPITILEDDSVDEKSDNEMKKVKLEATNLIRLEYRNYQQGSYTIMNDEAYELFESNVIDLVIPFNSRLYNRDDYGGYHSYLDRHDDAATGEVKETVRILADPNSLNLIARNNNMRFLRYITHHVPFKNKSSFQELNGVYYEKANEVPGIQV